MDLSGVMHQKIGGIPAPVIIVGGGLVVGLYLRSRNKSAAATTGTLDPAAVSQYGTFPTAVDPNSGAVYAIDPATGRAFQLPWGTSVPLGNNNGSNTPTPPSQTPVVPSVPGTPGRISTEPVGFTTFPPIGNVRDHQGSVITSNPIGNVNLGTGTYPSNVPVIVGTPIPLGTNPIQDVNAGYAPVPVPAGAELAPIPQSPTQQPNYGGELFSTPVTPDQQVSYPFIYG